MSFLLIIGGVGNVACNLGAAYLLSWSRREEGADDAGFLCIVALLWLTIFSLCAVVAGALS